jgi:hypothetical protein
MRHCRIAYRPAKPLLEARTADEKHPQQQPTAPCLQPMLLDPTMLIDHQSSGRGRLTSMMTARRAGGLAGMDAVCLVCLGCSQLSGEIIEPEQYSTLDAADHPREENQHCTFTTPSL